MNHFTLHQAAPSTRPSAVHTDFIAVELSRFDYHMLDVRGLATRTRHHQVRIHGRLSTDLTIKDGALARLYEPEDKILTH